MPDLKKHLAKIAKDMFSIQQADSRREDYKLYFFQVQNMMTQNTLESDKALGTFAIAALAALAALNEKIFGPYGKLSYATLVCFLLVVTLVTVGYYISGKLLESAQKQLTHNYTESPDTPLNAGMDKLKFATTSKIINFASMTLFVVGMILFIILLGMYIRGVQ